MNLINLVKIILGGIKMVVLITIIFLIISFVSIDHLILWRRISNFERKLNINLPKYEYDKGLPIGNQSSQFLAIFYLAKLQHFMIHNLHLKFINYMDGATV